MSGLLEDYRAEVINFLRTVTIKFEPFAYLMGQTYMDAHGITDPNGKWNPYYINLTGEYAENDTRMTVYSLELNRQVPFDKDIFKDYPNTAKLYTVTQQEYRTLEERYPENRGLIRCIMYPTTMSMDEIIKADNLTLLAYDDSLLEENEREDLVKCLKDFLNMVRVRWWLEEYSYEDMYASTFWCMLWHLLPTVLLVRRFCNIRTENVHSFHIWEYLLSNGLGDLRDVLSLEQALWLYRNLEYIKANKGKKDTLKLLAENLLDKVAANLLYKEMYQGTTDHWDNCITTPVFVNKNLLTDEQVKIENLGQLYDKLIASGFINGMTDEELAELLKNLGQIPYNQLLTKFLEFKKEPINSSKAGLMAIFFLDTLFRRLEAGDLDHVETSFKDSMTSEKVILSFKDMTCLWFIASQYAYGARYAKATDDFFHNDKLPDRFPIELAFSRKTIYQHMLPTTVYYGKQAHAIKQHVNVKGILELIDWHTYGFEKADDWGKFVTDQLRALLKIRSGAVHSSKLIYHLGLDRILKAITTPGTAKVDLGYTSIKRYRAEHPQVDRVLSIYEKASDYNTYEGLVKSCFDALFPISKEAQAEFLGSTESLEVLYTAIKELFIKLCSYNITFLETDRSRTLYLDYDDPDMHVADFKLTGWLGLTELPIPPLQTRPEITARVMEGLEMQLEVKTAPRTTQFLLNQEIPIEYPATPKVKQCVDIHASTATNIFSDQNTIHLNYTIGTVGTYAHNGD